MSSVRTVLKLSRIEESPQGKPDSCRNCGSPRIIRHGTLRRPLADPDVASVAVQRYRCTACSSTFRFYPAGVGPARRSDRLVALAALLRFMGLSCIATARVLAAGDVQISQATVWRAVRRVGLHQPMGRRRQMRVRVLADHHPTAIHSPAEIQVRFLKDAAAGETTAVEVWHHPDLQFPSSFHQLVQHFGATLIQEDEAFQQASAS